MFTPNTSEAGRTFYCHTPATFLALLVAFPVSRLSLNVLLFDYFAPGPPVFFLSLFNATSASVRLIVITARRILYPIRAAGLNCCGVRFRLITDSVFWALLRTHSVFLTETCSGRHGDLRSPSLLRTLKPVEVQPRIVIPSNPLLDHFL